MLNHNKTSRQLLIEVNEVLGTTRKTTYSFVPNSYLMQYNAKAKQEIYAVSSLGNAILNESLACTCPIPSHGKTKWVAV